MSPLIVSLRKPALALALLVLCLGADCLAQQQQPPAPAATTVSPRAGRPGSLRGRVSDEFGAVIVGAVVTLKGADGRERSAKTNREGLYSFDKLPPASYVLVAAAAGGFAAHEGEQVVVVAGRRARLDVKLGVTLGRERVRVSSEVPLGVEPEGNEDAVILRGPGLVALPLDADDGLDALRALAGPAPGGTDVYTDGFSGGRNPPRESVREVRINQNPFSAEFDRHGAGRIEIFTKPGTGKLRGQASFAGMDASLNSRNPFAPSRAPFQSRTAGGNLSGPLFKRGTTRASFFADAERRGTDENGVVNARVLDDDLMIAPFSLVVLTPQRRTTFGPRVDFQLNERHTGVVRYAHTRTSHRNAGVGDFSLPSRAFDTSATEHVAQLTETAILNARTINEARFQFVRRRREDRGDNSVPTIRVLDAFNGGGSQVGIAANADDRWELHDYVTLALGKHTVRAGGRLRGLRVRDTSASNFGGTYTFAGGVGVQLDANNWVVRDDGGEVVRVAVSSLERYRRTLLFGRAGVAPAEIRALGGGAAQFSIAGGDPEASVSQFDVGVFAQDDWRVRSDFTLSAGLRYEAQTNISSRLNLAPRVAFAWSPGGTSGGGNRGSKTVVRGGFGVFYERFGESLTLQAVRFDGRRQQQFVVTDPRVLDLFPIVPSVETLQAFAVRQTTRRVAADARAPYTLIASASLERQLPLKLLLTTTFTNARTLHALRSRNVNAPLPGTFRTGVGARPFGDVGNIFEYETGGRVRQNQLAFTLNRRFGARISLTTGYTLGKAESDTDGAATFPAYSYDLTGEMGRAATDVRHHFTLTGSIRAPWGVSLNPFVVATSGRPFNITTGRDTNGDTLFTERPAFATDPTKPGVVVTPYGTFDPNPAPGQDLIPRNYADGPGFFLVNLRLSRSFNFGPLGDLRRRRAAAPAASSPRNTKAPTQSAAAGGRSETPYSLTFSVQAQNLFNHTNAGTPVGNLRSTLFGQSNTLARLYGFGDRPSAGNRRFEAQVTLRF